jgi:hypothetical protein
MVRNDWNKMKCVAHRRMISLGDCHLGLNSSASIDMSIYKVFHFEVSISAPRLDLGSKPRQILTLARARSILDSQPLGAKARTMLVDFSDALDVRPVRYGRSENDIASDCCLSLAESDLGA